MHLHVLPIQVKNSVLICKGFRWSLVLPVQSQTNTLMYSGSGRMSKLLAQVSQRHSIPLREVYIKDKTASDSLRICNTAHPEHWDSNGDQYESQHKTSQGSQVGPFTHPIWSNTSFTVLETGVLHSHGWAHVSGKSRIARLFMGEDASQNNSPTSRMVQSWLSRIETQRMTLETQFIILMDTQNHIHTQIILAY